MDYGNQPVSALLRGPLVSTPQGWVVLASAILYFSLAVVFALFDISPLIGKSSSAAATLCVFWPFVVFLLFVKNGIPSFAPSWAKATFLLCGSLAPCAYAAWSAYA